VSVGSSGALQLDRERKRTHTTAGQNPTISVAVSLNRNGRFRKVAPGTFDLVMRDAKKAS